MNARVGQVWEVKSFMNGERVMVIMESNPVSDRRAVAGTVHKVLHITGKKLGKVLVFTELEDDPWEGQSNMARLD